MTESVPIDTVDLLRTGELVILGRIPSASNATLVCEVTLDGAAPDPGSRGDRDSDDASAVRMRCVYKPIRGEVPLWDFPDGTLAGREVASSMVSDALGWGVVPETVLRDGPVGPGMVQRWIDTPDHADSDVLPTPRVDLVDLCPPDAVPDGYREILRAYDAYGEEVTLVHADDPRLLRMAVLDVVLNNADRKGGHVLEGCDGNVYGVDHGICLHGDDKLRTVLWGWAGEAVPAHLLADLAELADSLDQADSALRVALAPHITDAEIDAIGARAAELLTRAVMPYPPGHRPIPWPPF